MMFFNIKVNCGSICGFQDPKKNKNLLKNVKEKLNFKA